jgi:hypothetical protein
MHANLAYRLAMGYAVLGGTGWLAVAIRQWLIRQRYTDAASQFYAAGNGESGRLAAGIAGARASEVIIAALVMLVFAISAVALYRQTWNSWDWATAIAGLATVASLIFLCAARRVIFAAPFSLSLLWLVLYRPGVKQACGVGTPALTTEPDEAAGQERDIDVKQEQELLTGLRQSLRVFEVERGIDTATFVSRYTCGLEEESSDNEEWFALARLAHRSEQRIAAADSRPATEG